MYKEDARTNSEEHSKHRSSCHICSVLRE